MGLQADKMLILFFILAEKTSFFVIFIVKINGSSSLGYVQFCTSSYFEL